MCQFMWYLRTYPVLPMQSYQGWCHTPLYDHRTESPVRADAVVYVDGWCRRVVRMVLRDRDRWYDLEGEEEKEEEEE